VREDACTVTTPLAVASVAIALILATPVHAQTWIEFVDKAERFGVNLPATPDVHEMHRRRPQPNACVRTGSAWRSRRGRNRRSD